MLFKVWQHHSGNPECLYIDKHFRLNNTRIKTVLVLSIFVVSMLLVFKLDLSIFIMLIAHNVSVNIIVISSRAVLSRGK